MNALNSFSGIWVGLHANGFKGYSSLANSLQSTFIITYDNSAYKSVVYMHFISNVILHFESLDNTNGFLLAVMVDLQHIGFAVMGLLYQLVLKFNIN